MSGQRTYNQSGQSSLSPTRQPNKVWQESSKYTCDSNNSSDTVQHTYQRKPSMSSRGSFGSISSGPLRLRNENVLPSRTNSLSSPQFLEETSSVSLPGKKHAFHQSSWGNDIPVPWVVQNASATFHDVGPLEDIDLNAGCGNISQDSNEGKEWDRSDNPDQGFSFELEKNETLSTRSSLTHAAEKVESTRPSILVTDITIHPIKRIMRSFRHKTSMSKKSLSVRKERWSLDDFDEVNLADPPISQDTRSKGHKKTSSWASSGFVTAVKSAGAGLATLSAAPQNRRSFVRSSNRSSRLSHITNRDSLDSNRGSLRAIDEAAWDRAVQRRRTLEELVSSEQSYIADLKVLKNVVKPSRYF